jgi:hypothetical protein
MDCDIVAPTQMSRFDDRQCEKRRFLSERSGRVQDSPFISPRARCCSFAPLFIQVATDRYGAIGLASILASARRGCQGCAISSEPFWEMNEKPNIKLGSGFETLETRSARMPPCSTFSGSLGRPRSACMTGPLPGLSHRALRTASATFSTSFQLSQNPVVFVTDRASLRTSRQRGRAGDL